MSENLEETAERTVKTLIVKQVHGRPGLTPYEGEITFENDLGWILGYWCEHQANDEDMGCEVLYEQMHAAVVMVTYSDDATLNALNAYFEEFGMEAVEFEPADWRAVISAPVPQRSHPLMELGTTP